MADTQDMHKTGVHYRAGAAREPGVTGGVSRGDHAQETGKQPVSPAQATSALAFLAHGALAVAFAAMAVLLAVAPETVAEIAFGRRVTLAAPTEEAIKNVVGHAVHGKVQSAAHQIWQAATGDGVRVLSPQMDFLLRLLSTGPFAASMILLTLQNAARQAKLAHPLYARLNLGLTASAASLLGLLWFRRHLLTWPAFMSVTALLVSTLAVALPPLLQAGPAALLSSLPSDLRITRNRRSALYAILSVLFLVEGLGIVPAPELTLRACTGSPGSTVAHLLIQAVALSTHVLVPAAALCLKIETDTGRTATVASLLLNLAMAGVALQHVALLSHAIAAGTTGPAGPVLLLAWGTALATAVYNMPVKVHASE